MVQTGLQAESAGAQPFQRARAIFDGALDLAVGDERTRFVEQAAGTDSALLAEVTRLLRHHEEVAGRIFGELPGSGPHLADPPRRIGSYTVVEKVGEGGMGAVFLAERADGHFERRVAIKLIRPGLGSDALLDRFHRERQILATLEHANIARLLDGGMTGDGQPFLVMEYVNGTRFDTYCDESQLDLRARLALFRQVCTAMSYAHHRLVVHRDLKPGNILVTPEGEVKLLDFGIAKVLRPTAPAEETTPTAGLFLTPLFTSPELLCGQPTTVSSDVYSLGAILYQVLTGRLPYDEHAASPGELISAVIAGDPKRPSTSVGQRLKSGPAPEELAARRGFTPERLQKALRGDLDGIVLRALAKNPADRYASVEQLAGDVDRYLTGRPVQAVEATAWYAGRKFVQRHKLGVLAAAMLALSLVGGLAGTLWQARVARRQTAEANLRFDDARRLANYLLFDLSASVKKLPGSTQVQAEMADRTLVYLDKLAAAKGDDRALQVELARGYLQLGNVLGNAFEPNLGQTARSVEVYRKGLAMLTPVAAAAPGEVNAQATLARLHMQLAGAQTFLGKPSEMLPHARRAVELFDGLVKAHPKDVELLLSAGLADQFLARHVNRQSGWLKGAQKGDEVFTSLDRSEARLRRALELQPGQGRASRLLAGTLLLRGDAFSTSDAAAGRLDQRAALAVLDGQPAGERTSREGRKARASTLLSLAWGLGTAKEYKECQAVLREAIQVLRSLSADDPNDMAALYQVAIPLRTAGIFHARAGGAAEAVASYREEIAILDRLIAKDASNRIYLMYRAEASVRGGAELAKLGRLEEAGRMGQAGLEYYEGLADSPSATLQALVDAARWRTQTPAPLRDFQRGLVYAQRADSLAKGTNWESLDSLATAQWGLGRREEAVKTVRRGLSIAGLTTPVRADFEQLLGKYTSQLKVSALHLAH